MIRTVAGISNTARTIIGALERGQKRALFLAFFIMVVTGALTTVPAVALGSLVTHSLVLAQCRFATAVPYLLLIVAAILARKALTVFRKYLNTRRLVAWQDAAHDLATLAKVNNTK